MNQQDTCSNCFYPLTGGSVCPVCGHDGAKEKKYTGVLPAFTILNERYLLGRVLGKGGFGITYIARDIITNQMCAIKEYMPAEYSSRKEGSFLINPYEDNKAKYVFSHGREKFMEEAKTLLKLINNPIVVDILDYFTQNNTAYLVMECLDGDDLRKMARENGGRLDTDFAKNVFVTVASSLMEIHKLNILHRDLSPENIIVTKNGKIKLIDFGAARNFVSTQNKGMSILLKPGFAPPEQYNAKGEQGPWSDVYALCATFYNLVSGKPLVDALFRYRGEQQPSLQELGCDVTKNTSDVIEKGMELDFKDRYKNFKELLDDIDIQISEQPKQGRTAQAQEHAVQESEARTEYVTQNPSTRLSEPYIAEVSGGSIVNKMTMSNQDIFKIGRSAQSCQYVISGDNNISRIHCYIRREGNTIFLADCSSNGTYFENGTRLEKNREYRIAPGTRFYLATPNHMLIANIS